MTERRVIRYFCDLWHPWPLWENGTGAYAMAPADYGLSDALAAELAWVANEYEERWEEIDAAGQRGADWMASPWARQWHARGDAALARLREEVASFADVHDERRPADRP